MRGARALLALRGIETPTEDQMLGGMMEAEFQSVVINFLVSYANGSAEAAAAVNAPKGKR